MTASFNRRPQRVLDVRLDEYTRMLGAQTDARPGHRSQKPVEYLRQARGSKRHQVLTDRFRLSVVYFVLVGLGVV